MATKGRITGDSSGELGGSELGCKAVSIGATTESHSGVAEGMNTKATGSSTGMMIMKFLCGNANNCKG